jgi:hypothetical protein
MTMTGKTRTRKLLVNSGQTGVVYDTAGHTIGGGERIPLDGELDEVGRAAVDRGYLRVVTVTEPVRD